MAQARNQNLKAPYWTYCFLNVYMAFRSQTAAEQEKKWGLLNQVARPELRTHAPEVNLLFEKILLVVNSVTESVNPAPTPEADLQNLGDWLQDNVPQEWKVSPPESKDLRRPTDDEQATMADAESGDEDDSEAAVNSGASAE